MVKSFKTMIDFLAKRKKESKTSADVEKAIEVPESEVLLGERVDRRGGSSSPQGVVKSSCIYRVLKENSNPDNTTYTPKLVSIGPLHHENAILKRMKVLKLMYLEKFLDRCENGMTSAWQVVMDNESKARDCYEDEIELTSEDFATILLIDGGFIVELLLRYSDSQFQDPSDYLFRKPRMIIGMRNDMILLENQLPFFLLEALLGLVHADHPSLLGLANNFFNKLVPYNNVKKMISSSQVEHSISSSQVEHFTSFLRMCHKPTVRSGTVSLVNNYLQYESIPRAKKLHEAGVKIKMGLSECLLDIQYNKGKLEIPRLRVDDITQIFFRNLAAFERLHNEPDSYIGEYIYLIDGLIENNSDVDLLDDMGIIDNRLGDNVEVVNLFNNFSEEIELANYSNHYYKLSEDLNAECSQWNGLKTSLIREYFNTPWRAASSIAAIILLGLTLTQTIYAVIS